MIAMLTDIQALANYFILFLLVVTAIAVVTSRSLLNGTILLGIFSTLMALEYLILAAPDVAITEASVGAGISTVLLLLGLFLVGEKEKKISGGKILPFILITVVTLVLMYSTGFMPFFGAADSPAHTNVAAFYLANSSAQTGIHNVVASILASYRGYDTLGETLVIFTASIAVFMLLGRFKKRGQDA